MADDPRNTTNTKRFTFDPYARSTGSGKWRLPYNEVPFGIGGGPITPPMAPQPMLPNSPFGPPGDGGMFGDLGQSPATAAPNKAGGGIGAKLKELAGYFTDEKQGMLRQMLLSQGIGLAGDLYSGYKQGKKEDEEKRRRERMASATVPMMGSILKDISSR